MRMNYVLCVLAMLWLGLLAAATCQTLRAAGWYLVAVAAGLVWTDVFVRVLFRKNWGWAVLWGAFLVLMVMMFCLPAGPRIRMSANAYCWTKMLTGEARLRQWGAMVESQPKMSDENFHEWMKDGLCPQRQEFKPGGKSIYHVCVEVPQEDIREAYTVIAHARMENRREGFALVLPYERWKAVADSSTGLTEMGWPLLDRQGYTTCVYPRELAETAKIERYFLSAPGLMTCVEASAGLADFTRHLKAVDAEEYRRYKTYVWRTLSLYGISLAALYGLFVRLVWCRLRSKSGHMPVLGEDARWMASQVARVPIGMRNTWRRQSASGKIAVMCLVMAGIVVCLAAGQGAWVVVRGTLWLMWLVALVVFIKRGKISAVAILLMIAIFALMSR